MEYDVIIVGAGPAGLFSAYELISKNKKLKVCVLDQGSCVKNRVCPMAKKGVPCQNCNPCAILSGYGGAGTFSDGKLNYIYKLGKSDLSKYMLESEATTHKPPSSSLAYYYSTILSGAIRLNKSMCCPTVLSK